MFVGVYIFKSKNCIYGIIPSNKNTLKTETAM